MLNFPDTKYIRGTHRTSQTSLTSKKKGPQGPQRRKKGSSFQLIITQPQIVGGHNAPPPPPDLRPSLRYVVVHVLALAWAPVSQRVFIIAQWQTVGKLNCQLFVKRGPSGASEGSEQTKHWRSKSLSTNNRLPLQCFVLSEPSDAPGPGVLQGNGFVWAPCTPRKPGSMHADPLALGHSLSIFHPPPPPPIN